MGNCIRGGRKPTVNDYEEEFWSMDTNDDIKEHGKESDDQHQQQKKNGVVRLKIILTKAKAAQILAMGSGGISSRSSEMILEQLVSRKKVRVENGGRRLRSGSWSPQLDRIVEDEDEMQM